MSDEDLAIKAMGETGDLCSFYPRDYPAGCSAEHCGCRDRIAIYSTALAAVRAEEREDCAKVADSEAERRSGPGWMVALAIASAIRASK
jgi:hypothetical protein